MFLSYYRNHTGKTAFLNQKGSLAGEFMSTYLMGEDNGTVQET